jgi:hypothetical protein
LYFSVSNDGPGDIPENWTSLASVAIDGVPEGNVLLSKPTTRTKGGAEKPGGTSTYLTAYSIENIVRVDIVLDYNQAIQDAHRDDNVRNSLYVAPCDLPDLVVDEVTLDEQCRLTMKLRNAGPGLVPSKAWKYEFMDYCAVSIFLGEKQWACIPLVTLDPRHNLETSGGSLVYKSDLKVPDGTLVTVIIDSTANVIETDEQQNKMAAVLSCKK